MTYIVSTCAVIRYASGAETVTHSVLGVNGYAQALQIIKHNGKLHRQEVKRSKPVYERLSCAFQPLQTSGCWAVYLLNGEELAIQIDALTLPGNCVRIGVHEYKPKPQAKLVEFHSVAPKHADIINRDHIKFHELFAISVAEIRELLDEIKSNS
ncbi:MAG: hypothetical protein ACRC1V_04275 [Plesiomonas sp.]